MATSLSKGHGTAAAVFVVAAVLSAGCAASTSPGSSNIHAGRQSLQIIGPQLSSNPTLPLCTPLGSPPQGTTVTTVVTLTQQGSSWVAQADPALGDLQITFEVTGSSPSGPTISGTGQGTALNSDQLVPPLSGVRFSFAGSPNAAAQVTGTVPEGAQVITGQATGSMTFTDSHGVVGSCGYVQLLFDYRPTLAAKAARVHYDERATAFRGPG